MFPARDQELVVYDERGIMCEVNFHLFSYFHKFETFFSVQVVFQNILLSFFAELTKDSCTEFIN